MKLAKLVGELVDLLGQHGDCEVELQEKNADCDSTIFIVLEVQTTETLIKLRSWPY